MSKIKLIVILINLGLLLSYFGWSVFAKEKTLKNGQLVLLELAPVDPRSLMQGDYMRLDYKINNGPAIEKLDKRGYCIVTTDNNGLGQRIRFQPDLQPLKAGEQPIRYFYGGNSSFRRIHIGAESYFFEEGKGKKYEAAKYGGLKVDDKGNSILIGLYNEQRELIK